LIARLLRPIWRILFIYLIFAVFFCAIVAVLAWAVTRNPPYGDDTGIGILCISFPFAAIFTAIVFFFLNRKALREDRAEALKSASEEKSANV